MAGEEQDMKRMRINREQDCRLISAQKLMRERGFSEADINALPGETLNSSLRIFELGTESSPQLFESQMLPNAVAPIHSHDQDEIIYILDGEMILGTEHLKKGSSLFIAANARYGFRAGSQGVRFLNFRPRRCDF